MVKYQSVGDGSLEFYKTTRAYRLAVESSMGEV